MYKLLPGSKAVVEKAATMNLSGEIIVYKDWIDLGFGDYETNTVGGNAYPVKENLEFMVNGTLNVTGVLAGIVDRNEEGAVLDLSMARCLEMTSLEGSRAGALKPYKLTSAQHLFAYNVGAHEVTVDWSKIPLKDSPAALDVYKLEKAKYIYKDNKWEASELSQVEKGFFPN